VNRDVLSQRFARFVTNVVVRRPALWRLLRGSMRRLFDTAAPRWDEIRAKNPAHLAALESALESLDPPPRRVLDLGTGTGAAAFAAARRFPHAEVVGIDLAPAMIEQARRNLPAELADRVRFVVADAAALPYADAGFDLVALANMIPFFDELARVVAPGGCVVVSYSRGPGTPIYVPRDRLERELGARGIDDFQDVRVGEATALLARKRPGP
jgi:ubiquinone/menaquinone biosynthesis C-methylase UbiE